MTRRCTCDDRAVRELELTRAEGDRRRFDLAGVGSVRREGFGESRYALAAVDGVVLSVARRGILRRCTEATGPDGVVVGRFEPRALRRGGSLWFRGRELALRPSSAWRERYALLDGERELAHLDVRGWGRRPVMVAVVDDGLEPALLLFATIAARGLADDASSAAVAATG